MNELQAIIEQAWENRADLKPGSAPARIGEAVNNVLADLDAGRVRVAEKVGGTWESLITSIQDSVHIEYEAFEFVA